MRPLEKEKLGEVDNHNVFIYRRECKKDSAGSEDPNPSPPLTTQSRSRFRSLGVS